MNTKRIAKMIAVLAITATASVWAGSDDWYPLAVNTNASGALNYNGPINGSTFTNFPSWVLTNGNLKISYSNNMLYFCVAESSCTGFVFSPGGTNILLKKDN